MSEKKKKNDTVSMNRWLFLILWILAHIMTWGGTFWLIDNYDAPSQPEWLVVLAIIVLLGIVPGALLSFPQKWLMKQGFGLDVKWWRRASITAWASGGLLLWIVVTLLFSGFNDPPEFVFVLSWFGPLIFVQYALLRRYIQPASLFALSNLASVIIFGQFVGLYGDPALERFVFAGGLQGAVTGLTLLWLYGMAQQEKSKHEQAQDDVAIERLSDSSTDVAYQLEDGTDSASTASYS